jgi:hypothetical protein
VLATTRLAAQRSVSLREWREALQADLTAFRDASAAAEDRGQAWQTVVEALSGIVRALETEAV